MDIEAAPPEQRCHAIQHARLILDVDGKCVQGVCRHGQSAAVSAIGFGLRIIACRSAPAGTIGYTVSSCSTRKSITAARLMRRAAATASATSLRFVTRVAAMPNASASFAKFGLSNGVAAYRLS